MVDIFSAIITSNITPIDFSKMIHKKDDKLLRENFRAIELLSIPGKILLEIVLKSY